MNSLNLVLQCCCSTTMTDSTLSQEQLDVCKQIVNGNNSCFVTGRPGELTFSLYCHYVCMRNSVVEM